MKWMTILDKILKKPPLFVLLPISLLFILLLLKWQFTFPIISLTFFLGGVIGIYLLEIAEVFVNSHPSPFRTMLFMLLLGVTTFYTISSTNSYFAKGICLFLLLDLVMKYTLQWKKGSSLDEWFSLLFDNLNSQVKKTSGWFVLGIYIFLCVVFIT